MLPGGGGPTSSPAYSPREDLAPNIMDSGAGSDPNMRRDLEGLESVRPPVATLRRATTDADAVVKALRVIKDGLSLPEACTPFLSLPLRPLNGCSPDTSTRARS